jgi:hypothetical protein
MVHIRERGGLPFAKLVVDSNVLRRAGCMLAKKVAAVKVDEKGRCGVALESTWPEGMV